MLRTQDETRAQEALEKAIQRTLAQTTATIERVQREVPRDSIVRANALQFTHDATGLKMAAAGQPWRLHNHALGQVAEQASVPKPYVDGLTAGEEWEKNLLDHILSTTFAHSSDRHLIRSIDTGGGQLEARGFLSDKFRRLDSRPLLETFVGEVQRFGAKPYAGVMTDTRVSLKALLPKPFVFTVPEGAMRADHQHGGAGLEAVALGIEWRNSDYGTSRNNLAVFLLRLWCLNGAVLEDAMRQVHLGGRLDENIQFSEQTYQLDTRASVSAMRDVVRGLLAPARVEQTIDRIKALSTTVVSWDKVKAQFAKGLTKEELRKVDEAYQGADVQNLPPGDTAWRASNALSWIANQTDNQERRLELEKLAGTVLKAA